MNRVLSPRSIVVFSCLWIAATTVAYILSGLVFHFPAALPPSNGEVFNPAGVLGALVNGVATGALVGFSQMLLLRIIGRGTWRWAAGTGVMLWLIHTIGDVFPDSAALPLVTVLGGVLLGGAQWWAQGWPLRHGLIWLAGTAVPWAVGIHLGLQLTVGADWRTEHIIVGLLTGILLGAVTGLIWLWRLSNQSSLTETRVPATGEL